MKLSEIIHEYLIQNPTTVEANLAFLGQFSLQEQAQFIHAVYFGANCVNPTQNNPVLPINASITVGDNTEVYADILYKKVHFVRQDLHAFIKWCHNESLDINSIIQ